MEFKLVSSYKPQGDQGTAIHSLTRGVCDGEKHQVLLGVTGSGKTYTMTKGFLTNYKPIPDIKKLLQPQRFRITWQSVSPQFG